MVCNGILMETIGISVLVSNGLLLLLFLAGVWYSYNKAVVAATDFRKMRSIPLYIK